VGGAGVDEIQEAGAAIELGEEDSGVSLGLGALDPVQARSNAAALAASFPQHSASIATHPHLCYPAKIFFLLMNCLMASYWFVPDSLVNYESDGREREGDEEVL
jgi:hypothetical protein